MPNEEIQRNNFPEKEKRELRDFYLVCNELIECNFDTMGEDTIVLINEALQHPDLINNPGKGLQILEAATEIIKAMYSRKTIELYHLITILRNIQEKLVPCSQRWIANFESNRPALPQQFIQDFGKRENKLTPTLSTKINEDIEKFIQKIRLEITLKNSQSK